MSDTPDSRLAELGITLPEAPAPVANYLPYVQTDNRLYISGQLPLKDGTAVASGLLGKDVTTEQGIAAAEQCVINAIAQIRAACGGDLTQVRQIEKISVFVASAPSYTEQPKVANGASDLLGKVFGEAGKHARSAVGVAVLPLNVAVEVDLIVCLKG